MPLVTAYIDTNCFIHLRDLKDLPWRELFADANTVELVVAPIVIDELDRLKLDREGRRRDRSRAALRLIEEASAEPNLTFTLRSSPISIQLRVAVGARPDWARWVNLDPDRPDDQLVACALSDSATEGVVLLSFDSGPLIRARIAGLPAFRSPEDWQLPEQPDAATEETTRLRRDLEAARATRPTLTASFQHTSGEGVIEWPIPTLPPLSAEVQQLLRRALDERFRPVPVQVTRRGYPFDLGSSLLGGISTEDVADYHNKLGRFLNAKKDALATLHERVRSALHLVQFEYLIGNDSQVTASNLRVEVQAWTGARLIGDREGLAKYRFEPFFLKPPDPPREWSPMPTFTTNLAALNREKDPTEFLWLREPDQGPSGAFQCREFRPARIWTDTLWVLPHTKPPCVGEIHVEISATNLAHPLKLQAEVRIFEADDGSWTDSRVLDRLPEWVAEIIRGHANAHRG